MASLNECSFIGNLGADPDVRYTQDSSAVTSISIACTETWKNKAGEKQERTEWVRVTAFGKLAEIMAEYLKKGTKVFIRGRMQTDKYEKDGIERYSTKIVADKMVMLSGRSESNDSEPAPERATKSAPSGKSYANKDNHRPAQTNNSENFVDDDIPF